MSYRSKDKEKPDITHSEYTRAICQNSSVRKYEWMKYKGKETRWVSSMKYGGSRIGGRLYRGNIKGLKNGPLKRSTVFDWGRELPCDDVYEYLTEEKKHPVIEQLVKIGMKNLAEDIFKMYSKRYIDESKTDICGILKIEKAKKDKCRNKGSGMDAVGKNNKHYLAR